jgi:hypothetical protein
MNRLLALRSIYELMRAIRPRTHRMRYSGRVTGKNKMIPEEKCARAGLCADCAHSNRIESSRGSLFYLCELSARDPAFPKYPRLPVLQCSGYTRAGRG